VVAVYAAVVSGAACSRVLRCCGLCPWPHPQVLWLSAAALNMLQHSLLLPSSPLQHARQSTAAHLRCQSQQLLHQ
jgi:hypothetical protein